MSPDGKTVVIAEHVGGKPPKPGGFRFGGTYQATFYDLATGNALRSLTGLSGPLALSPDGKTLAATKWEDKKKRLVLVDAATGEERATLTKPKRVDNEGKEVDWQPCEFSFLRDGKTVTAVESLRKDRVRWNLEGQITSQSDQTVPVSASSQGGGYVAVAEKGVIRVYRRP